MINKVWIVEKRSVVFDGEPPVTQIMGVFVSSQLAYEYEGIKVEHEKDESNSYYTTEYEITRNFDANELDPEYEEYQNLQMKYNELHKKFATPKIMKGK